ncbi:hypothetical protein, partial [Streptococcus pseudopneumoniae]|uniref:hypothetical protein n=1 Tax=Streptococcus pseudopneumoniae TaxID=257758 RepID=UPI0019D5B7FA
APLWPYLAAGGLAVFGWFAARRSGAKAQKAKQAEDRAEAAQRGTEGAAEAVTQMRKGKTPQEVKDANDAAWR